VGWNAGTSRLARAAAGSGFHRFLTGDVRPGKRSRLCSLNSHILAREEVRGRDTTTLSSVIEEDEREESEEAMVEDEEPAEAQPKGLLALIALLAHLF
jgi:hypothetical protein